jgi:hypothetical protein
MQPKRLSVALLSLAAMAHSQAAIAAECVTEQEVSGLAIYALPSIVNGIGPICSAHLSSQGYLAQKSQGLAERYAQLGDANWPLAKSAMLKFIEKKDSGFEALASLPDNAVRPLVEAVLVQKITADIKPQDCPKIERGMEIIDKLPPETVGEVIGFIMGMVKPKSPEICPTEQP